MNNAKPITVYRMALAEKTPAVNLIKNGIWDKKKCKYFKFLASCCTVYAKKKTKKKTTMKRLLICQPEFPWLRSIIVAWPLCKCHSGTVLQWLCCTHVNPALSCNDLCDQMMSSEGQQSSYATQCCLHKCHLELISHRMGRGHIMLISLKTHNCFSPNTFIIYKLGKNSLCSMIEGIFNYSSICFNYWNFSFANVYFCGTFELSSQAAYYHYYCCLCSASFL